MSRSLYYNVIKVLSRVLRDVEGEWENLETIVVRDFRGYIRGTLTFCCIYLCLSVESVVSIRVGGQLGGGFMSVDSLGSTLVSDPVP